MNTVPFLQELDFSYVGPSLDQGPLPAIFYFALCAKESLTLDPFNQPVVQWSKYPLRVFSLTIPGHGHGLEKTLAIEYWAEKMKKGKPVLTNFIDKALTSVNYLIDQNLTTKIGAAGLSRGGYLATLFGAQHTAITSILGFAPVTDLLTPKEFTDFGPIPKELQVETYFDQLKHKSLRYYIGDKDTRVDTEKCANLISNLNSSQAELIITPSIGLHGHGTSPETFTDGANWLWGKVQ